MKDKLFLHQGVIPLLLSDGSFSDKMRAFVKHRFIPIHYSGFWDVPDSFVTRYGLNVYLFTRYGFDEELDDYPPDYEVYIVKDITLEEAARRGLWFPYNFANKELVGLIPTADVIFDSSNREFVNTIIFERIKPSEATS